MLQSRNENYEISSASFPTRSFHQEHHFRFHCYEPNWQSKPVFRNNLKNSYESACIKTNCVLLHPRWLWVWEITLVGTHWSSMKILGDSHTYMVKKILHFLMCERWHWNKKICNLLYNLNHSKDISIHNILHLSAPFFK